MSLTVTEANDVQTLIDHLVPDAQHHVRDVGSDDVRDALARLADKSYKKIMAGASGDRVLAHWPEAGPQ